MPRVIVYIEGGNFQGAVCDTPGVEIMVVDYDNIDAGGAVPASFDPIPVQPEDSAAGAASDESA